MMVSETRTIGRTRPSGRIMAFVRLLLLFGLAVALLPPSPALARYSLMDGATLERETAALLIRGGYPDSGLSFLLAPARFVNIGFGVDVAYDPAFAVRAPLKVQLLESSDASLNLAAVISPAVWFVFTTRDPDVHAWLDPGLAGGVRFHRLLGWFLDLRYVLALPISQGADFSHFPQVLSGLEIGTGSIFNVIVSGEVRFVDYVPRRFGYGGHLGLGVALW